MNNGRFSNPEAVVGGDEESGNLEEILDISRDELEFDRHDSKG